MPQVSASLSGRDHDAPDHPGPDAHDRAAPGSYNPDAQPASAELAGGQETLDRYAAAGGMAPERIRRILADLVPALEPLHRAGRAHGDIAPSTIGLDASGRARLLTPPLVPAANAEDAPRRDGYAAFEQHSDDPDTPCGPWTDIYALSATACALLTGLAPPPALARCVRDDYVPLTRRRGQDEQAFCAVLDSGLALDAYARPQTIGEFARALRLDLSTPVVKPSVVEAQPAGRQSMLEDADGLEATAAWRSAQAASGGNPAQGMAAVAAAAAAATAAASISARPDASRSAPHDAAPATPQPESRVALYREGQEPARDPAAVEYEAAVAAMHRRPDPQPSQTGRAQVPPAEKAPLWKPGPQRQRAPLLMILAVIVMVAAAFYIWLRPQPSSRGNIVASTSNVGSGDTRTPTSNGATGNASNGATANGANGTMTAASSGTTGTAPGGATANAASGPAGNASGNASSYASNNMPAGNDAAASQASGNSVSSGAMAMNPGISGTAGGAPSDATPSTPGAAPTASSPTSIASSGPASPGTGDQGLTTQTLPNQTVNTVDLDKSGAAKSPTGTGTGTSANTAGTAIAAAGPNATPADAATRARATSKAPVAVAIAVRPWGEILVNGKSRGVSPPLNSVTLAPGTYDITIRNNAGPDVHQSLTVTAGRASTISHTFN